MCSLVSRPFLTSGFESLQYAKLGGKAGRFSHMRWRQVDSGQTHKGWCPVIIIHKVCIDQPNVLTQHFQLSVFVQDTTRRTLRSPPVSIYHLASYPGHSMRLPIIISHHCVCDSIPQGFPLYLYQNLDSDKGLRRRLVSIYRYYTYGLSFITSLFASNILPPWLAYFLSFGWRWTLQEENRSV